MPPKPQILEVWGEFACFSRPELKIERFSYPCPTPSAARGVFDAVYSKPNKDPTQAQFRWQVTKIEILKPIQYVALRRNEVKDKCNVNAVQKWMAGKADPEPIWADGDEGSNYFGADKKGRTQRQTMALKEVCYRLHAEIIPWPGHEHKIPALECQFRRRAKHGKCFYQPYFGCREFPAYFELIENGNRGADPIPLDQDIGWMLYDVFDLSRPGRSDDRPSISLFNASIRAGVMDVPEFDSAAVHKAVKEVG